MGYKRVYYVIFENAPVYRFWKTFLNKKINHCYVVTNIDNNNSITINQCEGGTIINAYSVGVLTVVKELLNQGKTIRRYIAKEKYFEKAKFKFMGSCVETCKDLLGINKPFIFTPMQFFKYLEENKI